MEKIAMNSRSPAGLVLENIVRRMGTKPLILNEVELKINGVTVSFVDAAEAMLEIADSVVQQRALALVSEAGLDPIRAVLRRAQVDLGRVIADATERRKA